jgi:Xaa-Pro aminopeptidase
MGALVAGYNGDLTRTIWLGDPDDRLKAVYNVVFAAQTAALAGLRPGVSGTDGDALARRVIEAAGHKDHFVHGLGHGLGVRVHEAPSLGTTSTDVLQPGEVVTVEPGVYVPGWGGVRIEDVVVITADGCRNLTRAPKMTPV